MRSNNGSTVKALFYKNLTDVAHGNVDRISKDPFLTSWQSVMPHYKTQKTKAQNFHITKKKETEKITCKFWITIGLEGIQR